MYVAPEWRRRGVGRLLLEELIRRAREVPGLERLNLTVSASGTAARALYEAVGFVAYGVERRALRVGDAYVDEAFMVLVLH